MNGLRYLEIGSERPPLGDKHSRFRENVGGACTLTEAAFPIVDT